MYVLMIVGSIGFSLRSVRSLIIFHKSHNRSRPFLPLYSIPLSKNGFFGAKILIGLKNNICFALSDYLFFPKRFPAQDHKTSRLRIIDRIEKDGGGGLPLLFRSPLCRQGKVETSQQSKEVLDKNYVFE